MIFIFFSGALIPESDPAMGASFLKLAQIKRKTEELEEQVENFNGLKTSKEYLNLEEMLLQKLEELDDLHVKENDEAKKMKNSATQAINRLLQILDLKPNHHEDHSYCSPTPQDLESSSGVLENQKTSG